MPQTRRLFSTRIRPGALLLLSAVLLIVVGETVRALLGAAYNNLGAIQVVHLLLTNQSGSDAGKPLENALKWQPDDPRPLKNQALLAYAAGDLASAIRLWDEVLARSPGDRTAHFHMGNALAQQNHWQEAAREWAEAGAVFQLTQYGQSFVNKQDWKTAELIFRELVRIDSANAQAHWALALAIYRNRQDLEEAAAELLYVIDIYPRESHTFLELSQLYLEGKQPDKALEWANKMREQFPRDPKSWLATGLVYQESGAYEQALDAFHHMLTLDAGNSRALFEIGRVFRQRGLDHESVSWFEQAVSADPNIWWYRQFLAEAYLQTGQDCRAAEQFKAESELNPTDEYAAQMARELLGKCP